MPDLRHHAIVDQDDIAAGANTTQRRCAVYRLCLRGLCAVRWMSE